jgi:hypothetical protein
LRAAGEKRQVGFASGVCHDQIGAGVTLHRKAQGARLGLNNIERGGFAFAVARPRDADAVRGLRAQFFKQRFGERVVATIAGCGVRCCGAIIVMPPD